MQNGVSRYEQKKEQWRQAQAGVKRARRWQQPEVLTMPLLLRGVTAVLNTVERLISGVMKKRRAMAIAVEATTFVLLATCLVYLLSLWQALNPFNTLVEYLSLGNTRWGYTLEEVKQQERSSRVHLAYAASPGFIAVHVPEEV